MRHQHVYEDNEQGKHRQRLDQRMRGKACRGRTGPSHQIHDAPESTFGRYPLPIFVVLSDELSSSGRI